MRAPATHTSMRKTFIKILVITSATPLPSRHADGINLKILYRWVLQLSLSRFSENLTSELEVAVTENS